ncbi:MAG: hypothetical protein AAFZ87_12600 [Planctomycetota bacterium]
MSFLKENWPWIVFPIALLAVAVAVILLMSDGAADQQHYPTR